MKVLNFKKSWICILLISAIILQSCSVYRKQSITFDEAMARNIKVKVTNTDGSTNAFDKIEKVDSVYYGQVKSDGENLRTPIKKNEVIKVQPKNKTASALLTVGVIVIPIVAIIGLLQIIDVGNAHL